MSTATQYQLEQKSTTKVATTAIQGGAVCVWDAFGSYWCEGNVSKQQQQQQQQKPAYLQQTLSQGSAMIYEGYKKEGFCGCGADSPGSF